MKINCLSRVLGLILALSLTADGQWVKQEGGLPAAWGAGWAIDACGPAVAVICIGLHTYPTSAMYMTKDSGVHFLPVTTPAYPMDISIVDSLHIWVVNDSAIFATSDGGSSWQRQFFDTTVTGYFDYIRMFDLNNGVAVGDVPFAGLTPTIKPMPILHTTDGGIALDEYEYGIADWDGFG
jgi:hypothetical protein